MLPRIETSLSRRDEARRRQDLTWTVQPGSHGDEFFEKTSETGNVYENK